MYKTIHKMPRRKCSTCKKNKKNRPLRRKHNKSHKKHLNVMRGGMEESRKRPRTHPEWWDLAVQGTHNDGQHINDDAIFVSFTAGIDVEAQHRFIENNELLRPSMFVTRHRFGCHEPAASVIVATNTSRVGPKTFTSLCKNAILHMVPFDMYSFGHTGPPRINLFIQYHDEPIIRHVVPIREYYDNMTI
jgi:hypothetical protein